MKSVKVVVIGFILAVALVAWPVEYTRNITAGIGFLLGAVLTTWLGVRRRKGAREGYGDDARRYTATTMMKAVARIDAGIAKAQPLPAEENTLYGADVPRGLPLRLGTGRAG